MNKTIVILLVLSTACICHGHNDKALEKRISELEKEVVKLKAALQPALDNATIEKQVAEQKNKARERMRLDSKESTYPKSSNFSASSIYTLCRIGFDPEIFQFPQRK